MATAAAPIIGQPAPEVIQPQGASLAAVQFVSLGTLPPPRVSTEPVQVEPGPRPDRILLGTLSDLGFRVVKPIEVQLETRNDAVVASWRDIDEFGTGTSVSSAIVDLGHTITELYRALQADAGNLGPDLQRVWETLKDTAVPRR